jgi:hypothetical protein
MGQQQLILLVLATVIVGIAIVVGIRAFSENSIKSNSDALIQDMVRMANDAQAWKQKPAPFGGQAEGAAKADSSDYTGASFIALGYSGATATQYTNLNGTYTIGVLDPLTITGCNGLKKNSATITVDNVSDTGIEQTALELGTTDGVCP